MIRWCAYCQRFLGESAPYEQLEMTHGICKACAKTVASIRDADLAGVLRIRDFYTRLQELALQGDTDALLAIVAKQPPDLHLGTADLLMGIIQPILYAVGQAWASGRLSIERQQAISAFAEQLLCKMEDVSVHPQTADHPASPVADIVLACIEGNFHTLGLRVLSVALVEAGLLTRSCFPSAELREIVSALRDSRAPVLGLSVSMIEQRPDVEKLLAAIAADPELTHVAVLLGGSSAKLSPSEWSQLPSVTLVPPDIDELISLVKSLAAGRARS